MKKVWIILGFIALFALGYITRCSFAPPAITTTDTIEVEHGKDSTYYYNLLRLATGEIDLLHDRIKQKDAQISGLQKKLSARIEGLQTLAPTDRVEVFTCNTGGGTARMLGDSAAIIPIKNIDSANVIILTADELEKEVTLRMHRAMIQDSIIASQANVMLLDRSYIARLENSYHASQDQIDEAKKQLKKEHRKRVWTTVGFSVATGALIITTLIQ